MFGVLGTMAFLLEGDASSMKKYNILRRELVKYAILRNKSAIKQRYREVEWCVACMQGQNRMDGHSGVGTDRLKLSK